jgi:hypothetical protein
MSNYDTTDHTAGLASTAALLVLDERGIIRDLTAAARIIFAASADQLLGTAFDQHAYGRAVTDLYPGRW